MAKEKTGDALMGESEQFRALGDPVRVQILQTIANSPDQKVSAQDLAAAVGRTQPTASHHLKILKKAGIVTGEHSGTWIFYRLNKDALAHVAASLIGVADTLPESSTRA